MNKFGAWLLNFMRGRYGYDELGRFLSILVIVLIIVSILLGVVARLLFDIGHLFMAGSVLNLLATLANWGSIIALVWMFFRMLSRKQDKRRAENERYLRFRARHAKGGAGAAGSAGRSESVGNTAGAGWWNGRGNPGGARGAGWGSRGGQNISRDAGYDYLSCPFCGQHMRVPQGKGKIAVKCPACGQKTIYNS